ncbi:hypothetical protein [Klenkia taihuensis]|uniref:Uncharacterized protein n=1 Tax=Klenkia taihuensis TaxID=1225127 RepID=A0A1I1QKA3_9ACTN|nr:hypothetical protein [Klenkia taihuensis]GHE07750.1 hypothetical protein GCM10011381_05460 [Klenkia taihuensis]SFD22422.1 hypothetical protein SAMN05661030_2824 [Klenkia taihuensis]
MSVVTLALLALVAAGGALLVRGAETRRVPRGRQLVGGGGAARGRGPLGALVLVVLLAGAAATAWAGDPATPWLRSAVAVAAVAAAALGGGPVVTAVLAAADPTRAVSALGASTPGIADPDVLRGGAWIGVLERLALAATLLAGWPEGVPVVLAVKGLGRFQALKETPAAERFIVGTLASVLWAAGCAGAAVLVRV